MKVSVLIPAYNVEKYIDECIESVLTQTMQDFEIICVDDGSTDRTRALLEEYSAKDSRIKVIHKDNGGLVSARIEGINRATGYYALMIDGDDWMESGYVNGLVIEAEKNKCDLVIDSYMIEYDDKQLSESNSRIPVGLYKENISYLFDNAILCGSFFNFGVNPSFWNKLFITSKLRKLYENVPLSVSLGEDFMITMEYISKSECISIIDSNDYYHYVQRKDSMVKSYKKKLVESTNSLINYLEIRKDSEAFWNKIHYYYIWLILELLKNQFRYCGTAIQKKEEIKKIYQIDKLDSILDNSILDSLPIKYKSVMKLLKSRRVNALYCVLLVNSVRS